MKLEWCPTVHRYVLIRTDESRNDVISGTESAVPKPDTDEDVKSRAHADREELQSGLEDESFFAAICRFALHFFRPHRKMLSDIIIKRCKVNMHFDQHPSMDIRSFSVDPECLRINQRDVKLKPSGIVCSGSFKTILEGEWCGQTVVIATLSNVRRDEFEKEVMHLARLQHPKVVRFFGWDYITSDAPNKALEGFQGEECGQGYIVTEKMDCDLEYTDKYTPNSSNSAERLWRSICTFCRTGHTPTNCGGHASRAETWRHASRSQARKRSCERSVITESGRGCVL